MRASEQEEAPALTPVLCAARCQVVAELGGDMALAHRDKHRRTPAHIAGAAGEVGCLRLLLGPAAGARLRSAALVHFFAAGSHPKRWHVPDAGNVSLTHYSR